MNKELPKGIAIMRLVGLVVWVVVPVVLVVVLTFQNSRLGLTQTQATWVPVQASTQEVRTSIVLGLDWRKLPALVAPAWQGTVTSVSDSGVLTTGQTVGVVDGVRRIAAYTDAPFYRVIGEGMTGSDVKALNGLLKALGYSASSGNAVTSSTRAGIVKLAKDLGVVDAGAQTVFDPGWVVFLPVESYPVEALALTVAGPAPSAGTVIGTGQAVLSAVYLLPQEAETVLNQSTPSVPSQGGGGQDDTEAVVWDSFDRVTAPEGAVVRVGDVELMVDESRTGLSVEGLAMIAPMVSKEKNTLAAHLVTPENAESFTVPSAALFTGTGSGVCVQVKTGGGQPHAVRVTVLGDSSGVSQVTGMLGVDDQVRVGVPAGERICE